MIKTHCSQNISFIVYLEELDVHHPVVIQAYHCVGPKPGTMS